MACKMLSCYLLLISQLYLLICVFFRRLCIVKGIFPREPKKKVKGNHHTYYHVKDISFLQHEPLLEKFREIKTYQKKVQKAKAKKNEELARLLLTRQPTYKLDRLIRERFACCCTHLSLYSRVWRSTKSHSFSALCCVCLGIPHSLMHCVTWMTVLRWFIFSRCCLLQTGRI